MAKSSKSSKKRKVIVDAIGEAHITASFNNIIISLTNKKGDVISWSSAGKQGFRGSKKNTPYAAQTAAEESTRRAIHAGVVTSRRHHRAHRGGASADRTLTLVNWCCMPSRSRTASASATGCETCSPSQPSSASLRCPG